MAYGIVYKGEFKDGLVYIGQTTQNPPSIRWAQHVRDASSNSTELKHFHRAIAREGEPIWSVIAEAENAELLNIMEAYWIRKLDSTNPRRGYNSTKGNLAVLYKAVHPEEPCPEGYWKRAAWWDSLTPEQRNDEVLRSQKEPTLCPAAEYPEEVLRFSTFAWLSSGSNVYTLHIPEKKDREYSKFLHEKLHITVNTLGEYLLSITTVETERALGTYSTIQEAFESGDEVVRRCRIDRVPLLLRTAAWHSLPCAMQSRPEIRLP